MFWTHTIWYLLLLLSSVVAFVVTLKRSRNRAFTVLFSLAVLGFTYFVEAVLLIVLDAYAYYPMITPYDPFFDSVLGNFLSQISVTSTAVLFCTLDLKSIYMFVFAFIYYLIDLWFSRLGIYVHHWYRSVYTLIGFIPLFWIVKQWYLMLTAPMRSAGKARRWLPALTLFFAVFAAGANSLHTSQKWIGLQIFHSGIYADMSKDHTTTAFLYGPALIVFYMLLRRWDPPHAIKFGVFAALFLMQYGLYRMGVIIIPPGWFWFVSATDLFGFYFFVAYLRHLLEKSNLPNAP